MKNIYICGPVTGRPYKEAKAHFSGVVKRIYEAANSNKVNVMVRNPMHFCPPDSGWHEAMTFCVRKLSQCHGIALLQGWQKSKGAALELKLAQDLHIPVVHVEPPVDFMDINELFIAAPETLQYYNARLSQFHREGAEETLAENRATAELVNRYLTRTGLSI